MFIDGALQGYSNHKTPSIPESNYIRCMTYAYDIHPTAKKVLMIGLGCGFLHSVAPKGLEFDIVETDFDVLGVAHEHFGFATGCTGYTMHLNLRDFKHNKYDIIFLDAFNGYTGAEEYYTVEGIIRLFNILTPGGVLCCNIVSELGGKDDLWRRLSRHRDEDYLACKVSGPFVNVVSFKTHRNSDYAKIGMFSEEKKLMLQNLLG